MSSVLGGKLDVAANVTMEPDLQKAKADLEQQVKVAKTETSVKQAKEMFLKIVWPILQHVKTLEQTMASTSGNNPQLLAQLLAMTNGSGSNSQTGAASDPALF